MGFGGSIKSMFPSRFLNQTPFPVLGRESDSKSLEHRVAISRHSSQTNTLGVGPTIQYSPRKSQCKRQCALPCSLRGNALYSLRPWQSIAYAIAAFLHV